MSMRYHKKIFYLESKHQRNNYECNQHKYFDLHFFKKYLYDIFCISCFCKHIINNIIISKESNTNKKYKYSSCICTTILSWINMSKRGKFYKSWS